MIKTRPPIAAPTLIPAIAPELSSLDEGDDEGDGDNMVVVATAALREEAVSGRGSDWDDVIAVAIVAAEEKLAAVESLSVEDDGREEGPVISAISLFVVSPGGGMAALPKAKLAVIHDIIGRIAS
ncbi:MAG: hypothetical protein Q9207_007753 [Kuettlingeria erythrocarpa]